MTMRHDFGLERTGVFAELGVGSGLTAAERQALWNQMAQVFDHVIAPNMEFRAHEFVEPTSKDWSEP